MWSRRTKKWWWILPERLILISHPDAILQKWPKLSHRRMRKVLKVEAEEALPKQLSRSMPMPMMKRMTMAKTGKFCRWGMVQGRSYPPRSYLHRVSLHRK
uniref:(northern house mosquito) hypothetical protein n=1 Tax=Culex pipiens TaxID=7175 RepID=A0A8D8A4Q1_CULPI